MVEYIIFGLPDDVVPDSDTYGFAETLYEFLVAQLAHLDSPLFYYPIKFILLHPLLEVIYHEKKVRNLSDSIKQEIGIK